MGYVTNMWNREFAATRMLVGSPGWEYHKKRCSLLHSRRDSIMVVEETQPSKPYKHHLNANPMISTLLAICALLFLLLEASLHQRLLNT